MTDLTSRRAPPPPLVSSPGNVGSRDQLDFVAVHCSLRCACVILHKLTGLASRILRGLELAHTLRPEHVTLQGSGQHLQDLVHVLGTLPLQSSLTPAGELTRPASLWCTYAPTYSHYQLTLTLLTVQGSWSLTGKHWSTCWAPTWSNLWPCWDLIVRLWSSAEPLPPRRLPSSR